MVFPLSHFKRDANTTDAANSGGSSDAGVIAGAVIVGILLLLAAGYYLYRRERALQQLRRNAAELSAAPLSEVVVVGEEKEKTAILEFSSDSKRSSDFDEKVPFPPSPEPVIAPIAAPLTALTIDHNPDPQAGAPLSRVPTRVPMNNGLPARPTLAVKRMVSQHALPDSRPWPGPTSILRHTASADPNGNNVPYGHPMTRTPSTLRFQEPVRRPVRQLRLVGPPAVSPTSASEALPEVEEGSAPDGDVVAALTEIDLGVAYLEEHPDSLGISAAEQGLSHAVPIPNPRAASPAARLPANPKALLRSVSPAALPMESQFQTVAPSANQAFSSAEEVLETVEEDAAMEEADVEMIPDFHPRPPRASQPPASPRFDVFARTPDEAPQLTLSPNLRRSLFAVSPPSVAPSPPRSPPPPPLSRPSTPANVRSSLIIGIPSSPSPPPPIAKFSPVTTSPPPPAKLFRVPSATIRGGRPGLPSSPRPALGRSPSLTVRTSDSSGPNVRLSRSASAREPRDIHRAVMSGSTTGPGRAVMVWGHPSVPFPRA